MDQRRLIRFSGEVQGVGFRYTAARLAGGYEITGYVRNLPDGEVEILVEGRTEEIDSFLQALRGRMGAYIEAAAEQVSAATGEFTSFNIRF
jgi:acylphosphatase